MKKWISFLPAILFYLLIFVLSSQGIQPDWEIFHLDKWAHFIEFGLMGFLLAVGFFNALSLPAAAKSALTFGSGLILAVLDEFHQSFVPLRESDIRDVLADAAGLILGLLAFRYLAARRKPTDKN